VADVKTPDLSSHLADRIVGLDFLDGIEIGKEYSVYGIVFWESVPWYYICEDESYEYPVPYFAGFFRIVDTVLPSDFRLVWYLDDIHQAYILPEEWADDRMFYEKLLDGNEPERILFRKMKMRIDSESRGDRSHGPGFVA
jgi:hypothetical protein